MTRPSRLALRRVLAAGLTVAAVLLPAAAFGQGLIMPAAGAAYRCQSTGVHSYLILHPAGAMERAEVESRGFRGSYHGD